MNWYTLNSFYQVKFPNELDTLADLDVLGAVLVLFGSFNQCENPQGPIDSTNVVKLICYHNVGAIQTHSSTPITARHSLRCSFWMHNYQDNTPCSIVSVCKKEWREGIETGSSY